MRRRELLGWLGSTALLAACSEPEAPGSGREAPRPPAPLPATPSPEPATEPATPASAADWAALRDALDGELVRPDDARYGAARELRDPRFDRLTPQGIAYARSESDVQRLIAFARRHDLPFAARCGGHSYAGYSSGPGLVCDVGPMSSVLVAGASATIGAGAKLIDVYAALAPRGMLVPGGTCPSVGIAGLTLGGGQGVVGRALGLTCDALRGLRMVTADGVARDCGPDGNADLYWASRGGGGGNFGVATRFELAVSPVAQLTQFALPFAWDAAADVLAAWQEWGPDQPDELWSKCDLSARGDRASVSVRGVFVGSPSGLDAPLDALVRAVGARPRRRRIESVPLMETVLALAGCASRTVEECRPRPEGTLGRRPHRNRSDVFSRSLSSTGIDTLIEAMDRTGLEGSGWVGLDALGGAIGRVAPDATAFPHRTGRFIAQYVTYASTRDPAEQVAAGDRWLDALYAAMRPHAEGAAYVNYIDPDLEGWERAYYGANLARLQRIKARHDPDGVFRFAQSIRPG